MLTVHGVSHLVKQRADLLEGQARETVARGRGKVALQRDDGQLVVLAPDRAAEHAVLNVVFARQEVRLVRSPATADGKVRRESRVLVRSREEVAVERADQAPAVAQDVQTAHVGVPRLARSHLPRREPDPVHLLKESRESLDHGPDRQVGRQIRDRCLVETADVHGTVVVLVPLVEIRVPRRAEVSLLQAGQHPILCLRLWPDAGLQIHQETLDLLGRLCHLLRQHGRPVARLTHDLGQAATRPEEVVHVGQLVRSRRLHRRQQSVSRRSPVQPLQRTLRLPTGRGDADVLPVRGHHPGVEIRPESLRLVHGEEHLLFRGTVVGKGPAFRMGNLRAQGHESGPGLVVQVYTAPMEIRQEDFEHGLFLCPEAAHPLRRRFDVPECGKQSGVRVEGVHEAVEDVVGLFRGVDVAPIGMTVAHKLCQVQDRAQRVAEAIKGLDDREARHGRMVRRDILRQKFCPMQTVGREFRKSLGVCQVLIVQQADMSLKSARERARPRFRRSIKDLSQEAIVTSVSNREGGCSPELQNRTARP